MTALPIPTCDNSPTETSQPKLLPANAHDIIADTNQTIIKFAVAVFGHTILTTNPMLLIESENHVWNMEGYNLLHSRTQIVSANFDEKNRIIFNHDEFIDKLTNPLPLNDSYINTLLLA